MRPSHRAPGPAYGDAIERHRKVGARKAVAVHVAGYDGGASSDRFIDLLPVDLLGAGGAANRRHSANRKHGNSTHDDLLLFELTGFIAPLQRTLAWRSV